MQGCLFWVGKKQARLSQFEQDLLGPAITAQQVKPLGILIASRTTHGARTSFCQNGHPSFPLDRHLSRGECSGGQGKKFHSQTKPKELHRKRSQRKMYTQQRVGQDSRLDSIPLAAQGQPVSKAFRWGTAGQALVPGKPLCTGKGSPAISKKNFWLRSPITAKYFIRSPGQQMGVARQMRLFFGPGTFAADIYTGPRPNLPAPFVPSDSESP